MEQKNKMIFFLLLTIKNICSVYLCSYFCSHFTILKIHDSRTLYMGFMYKINGGLKQKKKSNKNQDSDF